VLDLCATPVGWVIMVEPIVEWDVVVVGGLNTDYLIRGHRLPGPGMSVDGERFLEAPAGKGANAAVAAARLGARTAIVGRVGHDVRGRALINHLTREGVHAAHISVDTHVPTGASVIQVDTSGQKQILAALGANLQLTLADVEAAAETIRSSRVLVAQLEVPVECVSAAAASAGDAGARVLLDPAPPRPLPDALMARSDVIRANATEAEVLTGIRVVDLASAREAARALLARGARAAILEAEKGNLVVWNSGEKWIPELAVETVDATGAGDAFAGGLAVALAGGDDVARAAQFASGVAALATTALGAQTALPRRTELESFLNRARAADAHV
jgi:ribokinase